MNPDPDLPVETTPAVASGARPWGVWVISAVLGLEAIALLIIAVVYLIGLFSTHVETFGGTVFLIVLFFLCAVGLGVASVQHFKGYRWTRAVALVAQLLVLTIAFPTVVAGYIWGLAMLLPALLVLVLLFFPSVVAFTLRRNDSTVM